MTLTWEPLDAKMLVPPSSQRSSFKLSPSLGCSGQVLETWAVGTSSVLLWVCYLVVLLWAAAAPVRAPQYQEKIAPLPALAVSTAMPSS